MTIRVVAELDADGSKIVVMASTVGVDPGEVALLAKRLSTLTAKVEKSDPPGALLVPATWANAMQLSAELGDAWTPLPRLRAWLGQEANARMGPFEPPLDCPPPEGLTPYPWQVSGARMIAATGRVLITDEPGTGKTITAILGLVERPGRDSGGPAFPAVVVCPASVVDSWVKEWRTWAPGVKVAPWMGPKRKDLAGTADVYVTSYDTARIDTPTADVKRRPLLDLRPAALVIDEVHLAKSPTAERSRSVRRLADAVHKADGAVVALSGTPITHDSSDLWPALYSLSPTTWPSKERYVARTCRTVTGDYGEPEVIGLNPATEPEFRLSLLGQHRRVAKADVLTELPPKVYSVRTVELPPKWRKVYDDFEAQMLAELPDGTELSVMDVLSKFGHLSRLASAPADVEVTYGPDVNEETGEPKRHVKLTLKHESWKVPALLEVLEERPGQPVVTFAPSKQLVMLASEKAKAAGYRVGHIVGGQSMTERTRNVDAFQVGDLDLICVTTGAGGVGITLTAASTAVFLQRPWSLVESIQSEDRLHRIGAEKHESIELIDVVASNTIDSRVRSVLRERAGQLSELVQDPRIVSELLGGSKVKRKGKAA